MSNVASDVLCGFRTPWQLFPLRLTPAQYCARGARESKSVSRSSLVNSRESKMAQDYSLAEMCTACVCVCVGEEGRNRTTTQLQLLLCWVLQTGDENRQRLEGHQCMYYWPLPFPGIEWDINNISTIPDTRNPAECCFGCCCCKVHEGDVMMECVKSATMSDSGGRRQVSCFMTNNNGDRWYCQSEAKLLIVTSDWFTFIAALTFVSWCKNNKFRMFIIKKTLLA